MHKKRTKYETKFCPSFRAEFCQWAMKFQEKLLLKFTNFGFKYGQIYPFIHLDFVTNSSDFHDVFIFLHNILKSKKKSEIFMHMD